MKLEKVVSRPKIGLWVTLFVLVLVIAGIMATTYNVEIVHHVNLNLEQIPWVKIVLVSLGFFGIIGSFILFFARLLREMKISQIQADFLDRISHELRTPISTLTLISDLLRKNDRTMSSEEEKLWKSHESELSRLRADVELLLQAARLRESRLRVNLDKIDLVKFFAEKNESFLSLLGPESKLHIRTELGQVCAELDSSLFELIMRNLLDNARKFALGLPQVEIDLRVLRPRFFIGSKRFLIEVRDQGLGFSPEKGSELFKRFSRLASKNTELQTSAIPGTGLGLYLSASASKAMGLTLTGMSLGEGRGARFTIEGPIL